MHHKRSLLHRNSSDFFPKQKLGTPPMLRAVRFVSDSGERAIHLPGTSMTPRRAPFRSYISTPSPQATYTLSELSHFTSVGTPCRTKAKSRRLVRWSLSRS